MDPLLKFFQIPLVRFAIHFVLIFGLFFNSYYLFEVWKIEKANRQSTQVNQILRRDLEEIRNKNNYENSDLFKDKAIKRESYKKTGEQVIDTSTFEPSIAGENADYIPDISVQSRSNIEKWLDCLFGNDFSFNRQKNQDVYIYSNCRGNG